MLRLLIATLLVLPAFGQEKKVAAPDEALIESTMKPRSRARSSVDLPWYPPATISVTPFGSPMPTATSGTASVFSLDSSLGESVNGSTGG